MQGLKDLTRILKRRTTMINYMEKFKVNGSLAIIIGGTGLLGSEVSKALAQAGAKVVIADINQTAATELAKEIQDQGNTADVVNLDISDMDNIETNMSSLFEKYACPDILINLAYPRTDDWGTEEGESNIDSWRKNVDIHMNSYCVIAKIVAEEMKKSSKKGSIINYGSIYGVGGNDSTIYKGTTIRSASAYAAIKGGIINFTRYLSSIYGKDGIRINTICPGGIFDNQNKTFVNQYNEKVPLGRMGNPEEIASATLFLASEAASYITGATIMVDGGWTAI